MNPYNNGCGLFCSKPFEYNSETLVSGNITPCHALMVGQFVWVCRWCSGLLCGTLYFQPSCYLVPLIGHRISDKSCSTLLAVCTVFSQQVWEAIHKAWEAIQAGGDHMRVVCVSSVIWVSYMSNKNQKILKSSWVAGCMQTLQFFCTKKQIC